MIFEKKHYSLKALVDAWNSGSLIRNPEYQRGEGLDPVCDGSALARLPSFNLVE